MPRAEGVDAAPGGLRAGRNRQPDHLFGHPYTVSEQNFTIELIQPRGGNQHAVFFVHPREAINYHYERHPTDPRVSHALTLER